MNKIKKYSIRVNNNSYNFGVNKWKVLLGDCYQKRHDILSSIRSTFEKLDNSEYSYENSFDYFFRINDTNINLREYKLLEVNLAFDFVKEEKLGTKSIYVNLLETIFKDIEYNEIVNTINYLKNDLADEMNDKLASLFEKHQLQIQFEDFNIKNIIKQIIANNILDDYKVNYLNYTYEELIIHQLEVIGAIVSQETLYKYIVIVDIPILTNQIFTKIKNMNYENTSFIINSVKNEEKELFPICNLLLLNEQDIDLESDIEIYNKITMNLLDKATIEETIEVINDYLNGNSTEEVERFIKII